MDVLHFILLFVLVAGAFAQLTVNVKNKGGDILKETITANTSIDSIDLDFQKSDGTVITHFIDFKNEIQIFKALVLGEEERGQSSYQVMCFVTRFIKNEFISSDAMSKLRQKNPGTIRHPEEDKTPDTFTMDLMLIVEHAHIISPHIATVCHDARDSTYALDNDLKILSRSLNKDYTILLSTTKRTSMYRMSRCPEVHDISRACSCNYEICIGWYPCGLKYCRGKDSGGKTVSYRCGIKTCSKCRIFSYYVRRKQHCIWDENEVTLNLSSQKSEEEVPIENELGFENDLNDNKNEGIENDLGEGEQGNLENGADAADHEVAREAENLDKDGYPELNVVK